MRKPKSQDIKLSRETLYNLQPIQAGELKRPAGGASTIGSCTSGAVRCFQTCLHC